MLSELLKNMGSKGLQERNSLGSLGGVGGGRRQDLGRSRSGAGIWIEPGWPCWGTGSGSMPLQLLPGMAGVLVSLPGDSSGRLPLCS